MTRAKRIKRWAGGITLAMVAIAAITGGAYYAWLITPPAMPTTVDEAAALLQSPRYARLPEARRFDYMQKAAQLFDEAPDEKKRELMKYVRSNPQARKAYEQAMRDRIFMEVRNYVLADPFDRQVLVDRVVNMQRIMESRIQPKPKGEDTPERKAKREQRQREFMTRFQKQMEQGNPQHQAYAGEFFKAIMERRKQMGLSSWPEPR